MKSVEIDVLIGKTLKSVIVSDDKERVTFITDVGNEYIMHHEQDCCENVYLEDVCGDVDWLIGTPILKASEDTNKDETPDGIKEPVDEESYLWTFYNLATANGHVTMRWFGSSNGYYSESVDFELAK